MRACAPRHRKTYFPVPFSVDVSVETVPEPSLTTTWNAAVSGPTTEGVKETSNLQLAASGASVPEHEPLAFVMWKSPALAPVIEAARPSDMCVWLITVSTLVLPLVVPTLVAGKVDVAGPSEAAPVPVPVPVRATIIGSVPKLSVTVKVALSAPFTMGVNWIRYLQNFPGFSVPVQVVLVASTAKSLAFGPENE